MNLLFMLALVVGSAIASQQSVPAPPPRAPSQVHFLCKALVATTFSKLNQVTIFNAADYSEQVRISFANNVQTRYESVQSIMLPAKKGWVFTGETNDRKGGSAFTLYLDGPSVVAKEGALAFYSPQGSFEATCIKA